MTTRLLGGELGYHHNPPLVKGQNHYDFESAGSNPAYSKRKFLLSLPSSATSVYLMEGSGVVQVWFLCPSSSCHRCHHAVIAFAFEIVVKLSSSICCRCCPVPAAVVALLSPLPLTSSRLSPLPLPSNCHVPVRRTIVLLLSRSFLFWFCIGRTKLTLCNWSDL